MSQSLSWKCSCDYLCKHLSNGCAFVTKRTFYHHRQQDALGKVHPSVSKRRRVQLESDCPSTSALVTPLSTPTTMSTLLEPQVSPSIGPINRVERVSKGERHTICRCSLYCGGGRQVHASTYYRHQDLLKKYDSLKNKFGLAEHGLSSENFAYDHVQDSSDREHMSFEAEVDDQSQNEAPMDTNDVLEDDFSILYMELIERVVELQSLWDEHRLPIGVQDKMLRLMFGDFGGSRVSCPSAKQSLARLLIQLPSTWEGDLGGIRVPACWDQLQTMLKGLGMISAQRYRVCTGYQGARHPPQLLQPSSEDNFIGEMPKCLCSREPRSKKLKRDCLQCCEKCPVCEKPRKCMLSFDYIPIGPQLKLLTKCNTFCHEMLNVWRHKQEWLPEIVNDAQRRIVDFWNGTKFQEVKDFWDPMVLYELPVVCSNPVCKKIYTTFPSSKRHEALQRGWDADKGAYQFTCLECLEDIQCNKKFQRGDPRNVALLLHWDGFQTSRTTQKSCGAVEILLLNAGPNSSIEVLPVLFIPQSCKKSIKSSGDVFATCLTPLVDELEKLYLHGVDVIYEYPVEKVFEDPEGYSKLCTIRAMVMMVTGDHPAQCKIGMFKNGGSDFCRRDKAQATLVKDGTKLDGRYVYNENRYQSRFPPPHRTVGEMKAALEEARRCCTQVEKEAALKKAGLSGVSILWRLTDLYGFDVSLDCVYDVMHTMSLNIFKKYISHLIQKADASQKKEIDAAVRELTKVMPSSIRYGRWPNAPSVYCDSFKAEENQKFIQWCLPYILRTVNGIDEQMQVLGYLLIDIAHSFYNYSRDHGWSIVDIQVVKSLLQSWRIQTEEYFGANSSPLEHVAGSGELLDDVIRHGLHDRYWCYIFERLVKIYSTIKTNNMQDEASFVQYYLRKFFTRVFQIVQSDSDGLLPEQRFLRSLHASMGGTFSNSAIEDYSEECPLQHIDGLAIVSSIGAAKSLWNTMLKHGQRSSCIDSLLLKGIAISKKRCVYRNPTSEESTFLRSFWNIEASIPIAEVKAYDKVLFRGEIYKVGSDVVVKVDDINQQVEERGHWKACITSFFSMQHQGKSMLFFAGRYYKQCIVGDTHSERLLIDTVTGMSVLEKIPLPFTWDCIRPISSLLHKFIPMPLSRGHKFIAYEVKDLKRRDRLLEEGQCGNVPLWLQEHDIVKVCIENGGVEQLKHAVVREINCEEKMAKLAILKPPMHQSNIWKVQIEENEWRSWDSCLFLLEGWVVVKKKKITKLGELDRWVPIIWRSNE